MSATLLKFIAKANKFILRAKDGHENSAKIQSVVQRFYDFLDKATILDKPTIFTKICGF